MEWKKYLVRGLAYMIIVAIFSVPLYLIVGILETSLNNQFFLLLVELVIFLPILLIISGWAIGFIAKQVK